MDSTFAFNQISSRRQVQDHSIFIPKIEQNNSYLHEALSNKRYECNDVSTRPQNGLLRLFLGFYGNLWPWKTGFLFIFLPCSLASPQQTKSWEWHFMRAKTLMSASALRSAVNIKKTQLDAHSMWCELKIQSETDPQEFSDLNCASCLISVQFETARSKCQHLCPNTNLKRSFTLDSN